MGLELCSKCGRMHYRTDPCAARESTATGKDRSRQSSLLAAPSALVEGRSRAAKDAPQSAAAGTQAPPVDTIPMSYVKTEDGIMHFEAVVTIKRGRPRIHPDRKAYKAQKERERRARLKEGK